MTRQIQIRRGTATENDAFTGAVGEVTMDTTNNTLRVHDGTTPGGTVLAKKSEIPSQQTLPDNYDFVIESQLPTAENNYTWYRKYKSGWVEMGGKWTGSITIGKGAETNITISIPNTINNTDYNVFITGAKDYCLNVGSKNKTISDFKAIFVSYESERVLKEFNWHIIGSVL